jgi:hypothetical protein
MVWVRVFVDSRSHWLSGQAEEQDRNWALAIAEYESSIQLYSPFSPWVSRSAERLFALGRQFEGKGDKEMALLAYRGLRTSFLLARSTYIPGKEWIAKANPRIADLVVAQLLEEERLDPARAGEERSRQLALLEEDRSPKLFWVIVLEIGFFGWIGSVFLFIFRAVKPEGGLEKGWAIRSYGLFLVCFAAWVIGLLKA